ncbi:MAG: TCR/Tet family MFS transporter [Hyphomicrobiales bacterium]
MTARPDSKYAITFVFITVLLDMVGFGLVVPVQPALIEQVGHVDVGAAARIGGLMFAAFSLTQFLFGPLLGNLSDAVGRRPLLLLSVFGLFIDYIIMTVAPSVPWLFVGRAFAGFCGASYVIANAYISDVTPPEGRAKAFGMMGAAFGLGFVVGPALGGILGEYGVRVPFIAAAIVALVNLAFGYFVLPETLQPANRRAFSWSRANPLGTFRIFQTYHGVWPLSGVVALYFFATAVYPAVWPFWGSAKFGWGPWMIGITLAIFGVVMAVFQGALSGPAVKLWGEHKVAMLGLASSAIGLVGYGWAPSLTWVIVFFVVHGPEGFVHPMLTAIMSKAVPENAQGELQGGISSIMNLTMLVGTVFFAQAFGYFMDPARANPSPNVPFFIAAGLLVLTTALYAVVWRRLVKHPLTSGGAP